MEKEEESLFYGEEKIERKIEIKLKKNIEGEIFIFYRLNEKNRFYLYEIVDSKDIIDIDKNF